MAITNSTGAWPDATNTGVPSGMTLTPSGDLVITQAGAVISGLNIQGTVYIDAPNVTLANCKVTAASFAVVNIASGVTGTVVQNCEINGVGSGNDGSDGINGQGTFIANNIYNVENGINVTGASVIQDNYIHGLNASGAPHYDGIQIDGGVSDISISHNTVINSWGQTSAIMIDNYWGPISNIAVTNNLLSGGDFTVYADAQFTGGAISGVSFTNNHMDAGQYGVTDFNQSSPVYTGNVNDGATLIAALNTPANAGGASGGASGATPPGAPVIASFSTDSGAVGDGITNDHTPTLTGTAAADSTVKIFDGSAQVGTTAADSKGSWSYIMSVLTDAKHVLTATATDSAGLSGAASSALALTVDTVAPNAPQIASSVSAGNNAFLLQGKAEANSTLQVFDGAAKIGTATASSAGGWSFTTAALTGGSHSFTAKAVDVAGNLSAASAPVSANVAQTVTTAPTITSFSTDSGTAGDGVTNDNTPTLTGTAAANSAVKVFDGTTQIGAVTANGSGAWTFTAAALADGNHNLTATATTAGTISAASPVLSIKVDTTAPAAPVLSKDSVINTNQVQLTGTAEANSTVKVYDGASVVGTAKTDSSGAWTATSTALNNGSHNLTATATDIAGNTSVLSKPLDPVIGSTAAGASTTITSFSNDTGKKGDGVTSDNTLTLRGVADANSIVKVFDGGKQLGTTTTDGTGAWKYTTAALADGSHSLTAAETDAAGHTGSASSALAVTIDTHAPAAPAMASYAPDGKAVHGTTAIDHLTLQGTAEASSTVNVLDGGKHIGTAATNGSGSWSFDTGHLGNGGHSFTSTSTDAAGNTSVATVAAAVTVAAPASTVGLTNMHENWRDHEVTVKGTADAYSQIKVYDGTTSLGTTSTKADGAWNFTTASAVSNKVHTYTAQELDSAGHVVASSGSAVLGSTGKDTLTGTTGDDLLAGHGGHDTFVFAPNFGRDIIKDFSARGPGHDVVQFSKSVFDNFADVLSHATQSGHDVVIAAGAGESLTLKHVKLAALDKADFHFA